MMRTAVFKLDPICPTTVDETAIMWEGKNQATIMSLIPYSDIAEVGGVGGGE